MILDKDISLTRIILDSARENFETMIFMSFEEATKPAQSPQGPLLTGTITCESAWEGSFSLTCSTGCARMIALNMLGMDPCEELSHQEICDATGEAVNMIMESIKKNLHGYVGNISVSIPSVVNGPVENHTPAEGFEKITAFAIIEDEYLATLTLLYRNHKNHIKV